MKALFTVDVLRLAPELILTTGALAILIVGAWIKSTSPLLRWLFLLVQTLNLIFSFQSDSTDARFFGDQIIFNTVVYSTRLLLAFAGWLITVSFFTKRIPKQITEYFLFALCLQLGSQITIMAGHAITLLLAIELMSISAYALAGYHFRSDSSEAGIKFFLFGSTGTALMVFGFSWIYGATGKLDWESLSHFLIPETQTLAVMGLLLIIAALSFKMTSAPLHFWAPDVFQASPLNVLSIFSAIPKIAVVILLGRLISPSQVNQSREWWLIVFGGLAAITLLVGNFPALWQKDARRLMAYSSVGQAGFLLLGLCVSSNQMIPVILFYSLTMIIGVVLVFYCLEWYERNLNTARIKDFAGKGRPWMVPGLGMTIGLLSLTGLPPFAGFTAKFLLFSELISGFQHNLPVMLFLLIFGIMNTVVALFYYIKIPIELFIKNQISSPGKPAAVNLWDHVIIIGLSVILILLFVFPEFGWFSR